MRSPMRHPALFLFLCVFVIGLVLAPNIGAAWDEPDNIFTGGVFAQFFVRGFDPGVFRGFWDLPSVFTGRVYTQDPRLYHYPPVPYYVGTAIALVVQSIGVPVTMSSLLTIFHIATALFFALLVAYIFRFAVLLGLSRAASYFVAAATALFPMLFGHGLSNLKDTAQVTFFTISLYYLVRSTMANNLKDLVLGAAVWGLALATKFNAVYVPVVWGVWVFLSGHFDDTFFGDAQRFAKKSASHLSASLNENSFPKSFLNPHFIRKIFSAPQKGHRSAFYGQLLFIILHVLFIIGIGFSTAFLVWPYLWFDTWERVTAVVGYFTKIGVGYHIIWNGLIGIVGVGTSFFWYPIASFFVTTPLSFLAALGAGVWMGRKSPYRPTMVLLLLWICIPLVRIFMPYAAYYDGYRHFLEVLPPVILIAGIGVDWLLKKYPARGVCVAALIIGQFLYIDTLYFPYSTGYYNVLVAHANENFDRDIEGLSMKEGMDWLHAQYGPVRVWAPIAGHLAWHYVQVGDTYVYTPADADSIIVINKQSHRIDTQYRQFLAGKDAFVQVYEIRRGDALFATIYRKK